MFWCNNSVRSLATTKYNLNQLIINNQLVSTFARKQASDDTAEEGTPQATKQEKRLSKPCFLLPLTEEKRKKNERDVFYPHNILCLEHFMQNQDRKKNS